MFAGVRLERYYSQVDASRKLGSTCDSVWPDLTRNYTDLRSLWSRSNLHVIRRKYTVNEPTLTLPTERVTTHGVKKNGLIRRRKSKKRHCNSVVNPINVNFVV